MFNRSCSFSHDAKDALSASAIVLFVPGVSGGTCVGISAKKNKRTNVYLGKKCKNGIPANVFTNYGMNIML